MPELTDVPPGSSEAARRPGVTDTCQAERGTLLCMLGDGHEGLHYDDLDDISWTEGRADG